MICLVILIILSYFLMKQPVQTFIPEIIEDHTIAQNHCYYQDRVYPSGKVPGINIILTDGELKELNLKF